jgi:hypothetical protein
MTPARRATFPGLERAGGAPAVPLGPFAHDQIATTFPAGSAEAASLAGQAGSGVAELAWQRGCKHPDWRVLELRAEEGRPQRADEFRPRLKAGLGALAVDLFPAGSSGIEPRGEDGELARASSKGAITAADIGVPQRPIDRDDRRVLCPVCRSRRLQKKVQPAMTGR